MHVLERLRAKLAFHETEAEKWRTAIAIIQQELGHTNGPTPVTPRKDVLPHDPRPFSIRATVLQALERGPALLSQLPPLVAEQRGPTNYSSLMVEVNRMARLGEIARGKIPGLGAYSLLRDADQLPAFEATHRDALHRKRSLAARRAQAGLHPMKGLHETD
jgi:hypothetical protein